MKKKNEGAAVGSLSQLREEITAEVLEHHDTCRSLDATVENILCIMLTFPAQILNAPALRLIVFGHIGALPYRDARKIAEQIRERFQP